MRDLVQGTMIVRMVMRVRMRLSCRSRRRRRMSVVMSVIMCLAVMRAAFLRHRERRRREARAHDLRDLQLMTDAERAERAFELVDGQAGVDQRGEDHVPCRS